MIPSSWNLHIPILLHFTLLVNFFGLNLLNNLYASANFLRTHWKRLSFAIDKIAEDIEVVLERPPSDAAAYHEVFRKQYRRAHALLEWEEDASDPKRQRRGSIMDVDLKEYMSVYNGHWWLKKRKHYCAGALCCADGKATTVERAKKCLKRLVVVVVVVVVQ